MIVRNPQALLLLLTLPLLIGLWYRRRGRASGLVLALRLASATLVILALADPISVRPISTSGALVVLIDQSDSLDEATRAALREQAAGLLKANAGADSATSTRTHVLYFGANTQAAGAQQGPLRTDQTDLAGALRAARELIGSGSGRVVLVSDGGQTRGDAQAEARALAAQGVPIDTLALALPSQPELWIESIEAPNALREGEEYRVQIVVGSNTASTGTLQLFDGSTPLATQQVTLAPGQNDFSFSSRAGAPGIARLRAELVGQPDTVARNNRAGVTTLVAPPPQILLVQGRNGGAGPLRVALRNASIEAQVIDAGELPVQLSQLDSYDGVVLIDVPAGELTFDQMTTLREFVRSEGRGLVATGGRASFTLGAYKDTPLEELLPVSMTPPPRPQRADVSMLLIIDQSASMGGLAPNKLDMAKESAILTTESLRNEDRLGVLAFDTGSQWFVPFQVLGSGLSLSQIQTQISQIAMGGGTNIYGALEAGLSELERQPGTVRHAVLLTDGRSFGNDLLEYRMLLDRARASNITLSTIAIGLDSDTQLLQQLAEWGAGRYHFAGEPTDIPQLTLLESEIARTEPQVEGEFRADLVAPHPLLRDFAPNQIPQLYGYVATTLKPEAELVLESPDGDPVLAAWQYGLGRAVAWTPSVEEPWAASWGNWPEYGAFWGQLIRYTLPAPDSGPLQVRVTPRGDAVVLSADALAPGGSTIDLADTEAQVTLPDGSARAVPLRQTAPGHYEQQVTLPDDGPYAIVVQQRRDGQEQRAQIGYVQPISNEYFPLTGGAELLAALSTATGGTPLTSLAGLTTGEVQPSSPASLATWLLLAAILLWPLEIAVRRGWITRG